MAKSVLRAARDFLKKIFSRNTESQSRQAAEDYGVSIQQLEKAADLWEQTLKAAAKESRKEQKTAARDGDGVKRYSISTIRGKKKNYGPGVILDTNIFDGVSKRRWGEVLHNYIYENLAGKAFTVHNQAGEPETVYIARKNDRVQKDGAKSNHKVLGKIDAYRGNETVAKATIHAAEILEVSRYDSENHEHSHQWMDENGWEFRMVILQDRNGMIYRATLNIARGRDRSILYYINQVDEIDKARNTGKHTATGASQDATDKNQRSRYQEPRTGNTQPSVSGDTIPQSEKESKEKFSARGGNRLKDNARQ